ncbi:MAG TPA: GNAT family N-acetyltransferase [Gemmatimonadales bacterium]|nr:GNAT family N-acetyltransferase [Gemmatimonadales bacterium]
MTASSSPREWICAGTRAVLAPPLLARATARAGAWGHQVFPERVPQERWIRYRIGLAAAPPPSDAVRLIAVTERFIEGLKTHVDHDQNQLKSGLRFWEHGLRRAYVWCDESGPLCMQWLLMRADNALLRTLPEWAGMYPPLNGGWGQVENLFAFSTARRKGVATQFEYALYRVARDLGLHGLVTHIAESNEAARAWATRTGWEVYGVIARYRIDLPLVRSLPFYLHHVGDPV